MKSSFILDFIRVASCNASMQRRLHPFARVFTYTIDHDHACVMQSAQWDYDAVHGLFAAVDKDQDGPVSKDEWLDFRSAMPETTAEEKRWAAETKKRGMGIDPREAVKKVVEKYDADKDGALNQKELAKLVRAVNEEEGVLDDRFIRPRARAHTHTHTHRCTHICTSTRALKPVSVANLAAHSDRL